MTAALTARNGPRRPLSWGGTALVAAAAVTAAALYWRRRAHSAERANPPLGQFVEVDGARLHYVERGRGEPAIVILHGNGAMVEEVLASGLVERLAPLHRVVIFDRPGFGHTARPRGRIWHPGAQARVIREAMDELGLHRPVLVAHSWATLVALAMALRYPRAIRSLVLIAGYYHPSFRLDVPLLATPGLPVLGPVLRWTITPLLARLAFPAMVKHIFAPSRVPERFRRAFSKELALRPRQLAAAGGETGLMIPAAAFYRRRYRRLAIPALVVAGTADRIVDPFRQSVPLSRELPQGSLHLVPGSGHMVHHQEPGTVAAIVEMAATVP